MRRATLILVLAAGLFLVASVVQIGPTGPMVTTDDVEVPLVSAGPDAESAYISSVLPSEGDMVGATWQTGEDVTVEVRALVDGTWSEWVRLSVNDDHGPDPDTEEAANTVRGTDPVAFFDLESVQFRTVGDRPGGFEAAFVDIESASASMGAVPVAAGVTIQPRSAWDPGNSCAPRRVPEEIQLGMAIIHHTGIDTAYSRSDVPGIILGYCRYHRDTRGWDDIAYNFLIDRFGTIWEGRAGGIEQAIRGGHTKGFSSYSTGIAFIGNFVIQAPTPTQERALTDLLEWKLGLHNLDPLANTTVISQGSHKWSEGTQVTLNAISGHRDAQATACPGNYCYNRFGFYRDTVASAFRAAPLDTYSPTVTGDFTGDGVEDGAAFAKDTGTWLVTSGSSGAQVSWTTDVTADDFVVAVSANLNGDDRFDVVAAVAGKIVELTSTGSGFSTTEVVVGGTPLKVLRIVDASGEQTVVITTDGTVRVGPSYSSIGSVPNPVDAAAGDLDGDGLEEVLVLDSGGRLHVLSPNASSSLHGAQLNLNGSDRVVVGDFGDAGVGSAAAVDTATGRVVRVVASGASLEKAETVELDTPDHITEIFPATDGGRTRLIALDAYVGEWKAVTFSGIDSFVTVLEDQPYRTSVVRDGQVEAGPFLAWYGQEFGWLQSSFGYGQDVDTNASVRIAGASRYATNAAMTQMAYSRTDHVVLATSAKFPDGLAAGAVAAKLDGVLLLTDPAFLPSSIAAEIQRLGARTVTIAGGTSAVSVEVENAVRQLGVDVRRIGGSDRYGTAAMLSAATFVAGTDTVYVATGSNYPDALAAVPAAASRGAPILLVSDTVPGAVASELRRLKPTRVYVLGGPAALSSSVVAEIEAITGVTATRLGGSNRYGTALEVSREAFGPDVDTVFLVPGTDFLDALIAGPVAHRLGGPVLLTAGSLPGSVYSEIARLRPDRVVVVGSQVSDEVINDLDGIGPSLATELIDYLPRP